MIEVDFDKLKETIELMHKHKINIVFGYSREDSGSFVAPFTHVDSLREQIEKVINDNQ
jgi:hypothetical protein